MRPRCFRVALGLVAALLGCTSAGSRGDADAFVEPSVEQAPRDGLDPALDQEPASLKPRELGSVGTDVAPPMRLTASDGTGLVLVALQARAVVQGPLGFTQLRLTFRNPTARRMEGRFEIDLPPEAAVSRFAMKLAQQWQEGEVVERRAARQVYEDFLHRRQDPALLENAAGNRFSARVFPIPAAGTKEIIVSYSEDFTDSARPYRLRLRGLPRLGTLDASVRTDTPGAGSTRTLRRDDFTPESDFEVPIATAGPSAGVRSGGAAIARVRLTGDAAPEPVDDVTILFDTSASSALGFDQRVRDLGALVNALRGVGLRSLQVVAFDQRLSVTFDGNAEDFGASELGRIYTRRALGASNLAGALQRTATLEGVAPRLVVVSDGIATAGATELAHLTAAARVLGEAGVLRIDAIVTGGMRDEAVLRALVTAGLARDGTVVDGARPAARIAERLARPTLGEVEVAVPGSSWIWPRRVRGLQSGDELLVYAQHTRSTMNVVLSGAVRATHPVPLRRIERPLLERAVVGARIEDLTQSASQQTSPVETEKLKAQIVALSTAHRVLSDFTALLVLETRADYERFDIDRKALADIVTVGADGLEIVRRTGLAALPAGDAAPTPAAEAPTTTPPPSPEAPAPSADATPMMARAFDPEDQAGGSGQRHRGEEGKMGQPSSKRRRFGAWGLRGHGRGGGGTGEQTSGVGDPLWPTPRPAHDPRVTRHAEVTALLHHGKVAEALRAALRWRDADPADVVALLALGEALEAHGDPRSAARAYGSIIDLYPARADMRRYAGARLEHLGRLGLPLAQDTYAKATRQRPDHPSGHRLRAYALLRLGSPQAAFEALEFGLTRRYPSGRFLGVDEVMREDLQLIAAAWAARRPDQRAAIERRLGKHDLRLDTEASLRFVLSWETDANDVDLHVHDARGDHAFYSRKRAVSGGRLYADVTTGYGPECFTLAGAPEGFPYRLQAHYYSRGPMGYGMGQVQIVQHDGKGRLEFDNRPFIIMRDDAFAELGLVEGPASRARATRSAR